MSKHRLPFLPAACIAAALLSVVVLSGCGNKNSDTSAATTTPPSAPSGSTSAPSTAGSTGAPVSAPAYSGMQAGGGTPVSELQRAAGNPNLSAEDKQKIQDQIRSQQSQRGRR